jgi:hypothetical protein
MIAQGFGFTRDFLTKRNTRLYFRGKKIPCGFKDQARARHPGEKWGLEPLMNPGVTIFASTLRQRGVHRVWAAGRLMGVQDRGVLRCSR